MEWLEGARPAALEAGILDGLIRSVLADQRWGAVLDLLQRRLRLSEDPLSRMRYQALPDSTAVEVAGGQIAVFGDYDYFKQHQK
jgi:hypothetical protein